VLGYVKGKYYKKVSYRKQIARQHSCYHQLYSTDSAVCDISLYLRRVNPLVSAFASLQSWHRTNVLALLFAHAQAPLRGSSRS